MSPEDSTIQGLVAVIEDLALLIQEGTATPEQVASLLSEVPEHLRFYDERY